MNPTQQTDNEQEKLWNGVAGHAWVESQDSLNQMFKPFEDLLVKAVSAGSATRVLDVGCGTGGVTLAVARLLGAKGSCVGVDISQPMIAAAQESAEREGAPATFVCANAQTYAFQPETFDMIISRFGVMFFDNSARAFANLKAAAREGAEFRFIAWRSAEENSFMTTAERAAAPFLPNLPARVPDAPGQFAFADRNRILSILQESGWTEIDIQPIDVDCTLPEKELVPYLTRIGPVGRMLHEADEPTRAQIVQTVRAAFDPFVCGSEVRYVAACWMVSARASSH